MEQVRRYSDGTGEKAPRWNRLIPSLPIPLSISGEGQGVRKNS